MAAYSGQNGKVLTGSTAIAEVTGWKFDPKCNIDKWASSTTPGSKKGVAGVKDGGGSFDFKVDDTTEQYLLASPIKEGESHTLKLYLNATDFFLVPCFIESCSWGADMNDGPAVVGSATFTTNGAWTYPT